jgi:hypothetical protein
MKTSGKITRTVSLPSLKKLTSELPDPRERQLPQGVTVKVTTQKLPMISPQKRF